MIGTTIGEAHHFGGIRVCCLALAWRLWRSISSTSASHLSDRLKPFQKGELITHSPTHYELHYVARMWEFEPEDVTVPADRPSTFM